MPSDHRFSLLRVLSTCLWLVVATGPGTAGEEADPSSGLQLRSDPCGFYRGQAYGRGLAHFATEMLWACEAIAARRAADLELSERLLAAELALERYRSAVIAAGAATFSREQAIRRGAHLLGAGEATKAALADSTGTLAALEAIRTGF